MQPSEAAAKELLIKPNNCMSATRIEDKSALDAPMNAMIVYDEFDFAASASAMRERAAHRADEAAHSSVKQWRVEVLKTAYCTQGSLQGQNVGGTAEQTVRAKRERLK